MGTPHNNENIGYESYCIIESKDNLDIIPTIFVSNSNNRTIYNIRFKY